MNPQEERDERERARIWTEERLNAKNEWSYQTNKKAADVLWWGVLVCMVLVGTLMLLAPLFGWIYRATH